LVGIANNINQQNFSSQDLLGVTSSSGNSGNRGSRGGGNRGGGAQGGNRGGGGVGQGNFGGGQNNFLVGQQNGISTTNSFGINYSISGAKKFLLPAVIFSIIVPQLIMRYQTNSICCQSILHDFIKKSLIRKAITIIIG
jgi:hypothetical protein